MARGMVLRVKAGAGVAGEVGSRIPTRRFKRNWFSSEAEMIQYVRAISGHALEHGETILLV